MTIGEAAKPTLDVILYHVLNQLLATWSRMSVYQTSFSTTPIIPYHQLMYFLPHGVTFITWCNVFCCSLMARIIVLSSHSSIIEMGEVEKWEENSCWISGGWFNMKVLSYQYGNSHHKDKMVSRPSYFYDGNPILVTPRFYIDGLMQERCNSIANALELRLFML